MSDDQDMGASAAQTGLSSTTEPCGLGPSGFDPSRWAGRLVIRCTGFNCTHGPGECTADPEYQRYIAWKRGEEEKTKERILQWPVTHGYVRMTFPSALTLDEVADVEAVVNITLNVMRERAASAIETRQGGDVQQAPSQSDESAAAKPDAQQVQQ